MKKKRFLLIFTVIFFCGAGLLVAINTVKAEETTLDLVIYENNTYAKMITNRQYNTADANKDIYGVYWATNKEANCNVAYGETQNLVNTSGEGNEFSELVNTPASTSDGKNFYNKNISVSDEKYFQIVCIDNSGITKESEVHSLVTDLANVAPVISDIKVNITSRESARGPNDVVTVNDVAISWKTDVPTNSSVTFSTDSNFNGGGIKTDDNYVTEHTINITGLLSLETLHYYKIEGQTADGNFVESDVKNFTTLEDNSQGSTECVDSENGNKDYYTKGTVSGFDFGGTYHDNREDKCVMDGQLEEAYCAGNLVTFDYSYCEEGYSCYDGACVRGGLEISNVDVLDISEVSARISWTTNIDSNTWLYYGKTESYGFAIEQDNQSSVKSHSVMLNYLEQNTKYYYRISSRNESTGERGERYGYFYTLSNRPDLTVTSIKFNSPNNLKGEDGTLYVTIKNLGGDLSDGTGLLNWYNNFSAQNFIFSSETPSITSFKTDRDIPTASNPLKTNETITFSWLGNFNTSGNLYIHFTVDNANELDESYERNNILSTVIQIKENLQQTLEPVADEQVIEINYKANLLNNDKLDEILAELKELRDIVREQNVKIKYLEKLTKDVQALSEKMENAINYFITYGVDYNTKKLGAGERAAVMYSYKSAFNKLPETEEELADAIKIANGRWPSITSDEAEKRAKEQFQKIYKRIVDMNDPNDNAAITVMAYGLRQKAENRNLESEKQGINTFKAIYGYHPGSTDDWNIMQAITYSGASRGIDTDGDLLTDEREAELGTDPNNRDTDGDGYIDGIEVANGYDPLKK